MVTEKGILPFGIAKDGKRHREFEIRPQLVKDTLEVTREQGMEKLQDSMFFSLCLTAKQIVHIGDIQPVPIEVLLDMLDEDMGSIITAKEALADRLKSFCDSIGSTGEKAASDDTASGGPKHQEADPGANEVAISDGSDS
jgi:hypothetical protein